MASSFAAQLKQIAVTSTNELDLKAQKASHAESLIFEKSVAGSQDFETVYQVCLEGHQDLCLLDPRFRDFERNIFSPQSKSQDRTQMTAEENGALNTVLEIYLGLVGNKLLLRPAMKAVEWLVRRFKVHHYNTSFLILTFLPYHDAPVFRDLLSILPPEPPPEFRFLGPFLKTTTNPSRQAIAYSATNVDGFFDLLNRFMLQVCGAGQSHPRLLSFWTNITSEALAGRLGLARSGRKEVHRQRQEDILLKVLPVLSDGLAIQDVPELTLACYTLSIILASNGDLADHVVDSVMDKIVGTLSTETYKSGLVCLAVLFQHRTKSSLPKKTVSTLTRLPNLSVTLRQLSDNYELDSFVLALIRVSLQSLRKKDRNTKVAFAETLVRSQVLAAPALDAALTSVLATIQELEQRDAVTVAVRTQLLDMIQRLAASEEFGAAVTRSMAKSGLDLGTLELTLQMVFADTTEINGASDVEMDNIEDWETSTKSLDNIFAHVPQRTVDEYSFLAPSPSRLFDSLETAFLSACHHEGVIEKFQELSIWRPTSNSTEPLFISFLLRIIHRPYPLLPRLVAIKILMLNIERQKSNFDAQALLPYITSLLADPSQSIRREAANLLMAVEKVMPLDLVDGEIRGRWGSSGLYGSGRHTAGLTWLSSSDVKKIIKQAFLPFLEECVLDSAQISRAIHHAVKGEPLGSRVSAKTDSIDLKKSLRHGLFGLLLSHLSETPLYSLKLSLLIIVSPIDKVGQISRGKELLPMIEAWASLSSEDAQSLATAERIDVSGLDNAMVSAISPNDKDAVLVLLSLLKGQASHRQTFATAVFNRISQFWPALRSDRQIAASEILFDLLLRRAETGTLAHYAQEVLLSVPLSTDALVTLFEKTQASMTKMREHSPANKRRRTSQNQMVPNSLNSPGEMELNMAITTFVLELVDSSKPENRPQLLGPLFQLLAFLHYLKARTRSELPYLLSLNLASILAIVDKAKTSSKPDFETSLIRTELIIDCVRMTENPQVQKVALLLIASLCKIVPDRVLHNIMPIFTFMSTGILRLDDEHSTHVIDQTIDLVIPPLIQSLHAQRRDVIQGTSELLLSFIAAFDHIPSHRRLRLFEKLISKLGATEFLFAILGMLASKDATEDDMDGFLAMLMNSFDVDTQLSTFSQYIDILFDALQPQPGRAKLVLNLSGNDADEEHRKVLSSVETLAFLLRRTVLKTAVRDALKPSRVSASNVHDHLSVLLEKILSLTNQTRADKELVLAVTDCLTALLELPSLAGYMDVVKICLASHDSELRCRVLRLLEIRLQETRSKDNATQRAAIAFIPTLADIIKIDSNSLVKHAAVASIDRICEKYGRSDITTVIESARVVAGDQCLGGEDRHLKVIAILSLASTVEILKEAIIPVLPDLMPRAFRLLEESMEESQEDADQHNAVFSLLSALLSHVPFMVTEAYLDEILALSAESAHSDIGEDGDQSRREALQLVARRIDLKILVPALQRKWSVSVECSMTAVKESLETLGTAIERHSKSSVVKNADLLSDFLLQAFDFRRIQLTNRTEDGYSDSEVIEIESAVNAVAIKMIYKLNDAVFRPIFARVVDWAVKCPGIQREGIAPAQMLRQTTLFAFLTHFFVTLKSIVTSYASYILEPAVQVLSHTAAFAQTESANSSLRTSMPIDDINLWLTTLSTLREVLLYDADSFISSHLSHFSALSAGLVSQFHLSVSTTLNSHIDTAVIPTIVALATATLDSAAAHYKDLNHHLCALRHSESPAVRLASVKCQQALTDNEDVGEEWLNNVLRGGEGLVYVNEMLEDDDEDVEREVRRWVRRAREVLGEDILEA